MLTSNISFQVLLLASLMGNVELHSDNSIALGKGIFKLVAAQTLPQQAVPTISMLCETFCYKYGEVTGDPIHVPCNKEYFFRPRVCFNAWRQGQIKELNCIVGNHPMEDIIHIHAWVQLHYMHMGKLPDHFYFMPGMIPRPAELVPGRIYPIINQNEYTGTICICPEGLNCAYVQMDSKRFQAEAFRLEGWQQWCDECKIQIAPLIFRRGATIRKDDGTLRVIVPQVTDKLSTDIPSWEESFEVVLNPYVPEQNYLKYNGHYSLADDEDMHWTEAHQLLVALGTHLVVKKEHVNSVLASEMQVKLPRGNYTHIKGWLRYPDSCDPMGEENSIFIAFRVANRENEIDDVCVLPINQDLCALLLDVPDAVYVDFLQPMN
jgi:hypothetical protein